MSPLTDYHVIVQIQLNEALMGPRLGLPKIRWPLGCSLLGYRLNKRCKAYQIMTAP